MKKISYRKNNFYASETRICQGWSIHPDLIDGLRKIAKSEKKSVSWLIETALADYFGVEVLLRRTIKPAKPAYMMRDNMRVVKKRA